MQQKPRRALELRARYIVLLLLSEGPKTGYEIMKRIRELLEESGAGISPGTLYPLLRSLEEEGLVESSEEPRGARRRKVYRITRAGVEKLLEMMMRGLEIMETSMQLHIDAFRRLTESGLLQQRQVEALREIALRLRRLCGLVDRMEELASRLPSAAVGHVAKGSG